MERGLTIKEDNVTIHQVAIDRVAIVELDFLRVYVLETDHATILATHNTLGTRKDICAILDILVKRVTIIIGYHLWTC